MNINSLQKELNKLQENQNKNNQILTDNVLLMLGGASFLGIFGVTKYFLPYYDSTYYDIETINNIISSALLASTGAEVFLSIRLKRILSQYFKAERDIHDKKIEIASEREKQFSKAVRWVSSVVDRKDAPRYGEDYLKSYSVDKAPVLTKKNDLRYFKCFN